MKKIAILLFLLGFLAGCTNGPDNTTATDDDTSAVATTAPPADTTQARRDLTSILDNINSSFTRRDVSYINQYLAPDGLYMGTDPGEILNFTDFRAYQDSMFRDTSFKVELNIQERIIRIHGGSANMVEQYTAPGITQKLMFRNVYHARYENGRWLIDMLTYNVIPKNEDFPKIDKAL